MLPFLFSKEFFSLKNENAETGVSGNTLAMPGGQSPDQGCKSFLQSVWPGYFEALNLGQGIKTAEVGSAGRGGSWSWGMWGWARKEGSVPATPILLSREWTLQSGLRRPFPLYLLQSKFQGQGTKSSSSSVVISLFSESEVQKSKGSQSPLISHLSSARCSKGLHHLQKCPYPWSCVTSHGETRGLRKAKWLQASQLTVPRLESRFSDTRSSILCM